MATSFIDTFQNLADSVSSQKNGFTWDSAIRKFQYGVAGITLAALSIFETTNKMQCSTPTPSFPEYYYASSYCQEATWYYVKNVTTGREPYNESLRYFKWYILIPPLLTIISSVLYGALVDSFILQALKGATKITDMLNAKEDSGAVEGTSTLNKTFVNMAICARVFSETNMHYRKETSSCFLSRSGSSIQHLSSYVDGADQTELFRVDHSTMDDTKEFNSTEKLGQQTACYYKWYLFFNLITNIIAIAFINPYFFWFPQAISCQYRKEDLTLHWSICSVPGHRYSRVAVLIAMMSYAIGIMVNILSFCYVNYFIPKQILSANTAVASYTRSSKQQEKLLQCWKKYGRKKVKTLTATTNFILALIYQNIDRALCYRVVLAMVDIEKDKDAIGLDLPNFIKQIVEIDQKHFGTYNEDKEEKINEIRETILNPVGVDQVKDNIQSNILTKLIGQYLDDPTSLSPLFEAQQIQRITGVQLPKLSRGIKDKFTSLFHEKKKSDFPNVIEYYRYLSALYDISKNKQFFNLLAPTEIGQLKVGESVGNITDNGHERIADQEYDAQKVFDTSGYCWRSADATSYNWIKRCWDEKVTINLVAIQASHVNEKSTPVRFNFAAKIDDVESGDVSWQEISETYQTFDWLKDEWRVFPLALVDKMSGVVKQPRTNAFQINIFDNAGSDYFEIQKVKIYGTK